MATVVNTFPDRRAEILGKGLGGLVGNVIAARQRKEDDKKRREALSRAADLTKEIAQGSQAVDESDVAEALFDAGVDESKIVTSFESIAAARIAKRQREEDIRREEAIDLREQLQGIAGEQRGEARTKRTEVRGEARTVRGEERGEERALGAEARGEGRDIRKEGRAEEREESKFARALKISRMEEIKKGVDERLLNLELGRVLQEGATGQLDAGEMFRVIAGAEVPPDMKFKLLDRLSKGELGVELGIGFEKIDVFDKDSGRKTTLSVPEDIAKGSRQEQDAYFEERGFNVSTQPIRVQAAEERILDQMIAAAGGEDDPDAKRLVLNKKAGLIDIKADNQGNVVITSLVHETARFIPNPIMDAVAARQVQFKIASIEDALTSLENLDLTKVGLDDYITANWGGFATTAPFGVGWVAGHILDFLNLEPSEIAAAQAARASFFATLAPIAKSIATEEGERNAISSPAAIELAEDIVLITGITTTEMGARIAVERLKKTLQTIKVELMAQLQHRSMLRPRIIDVDLSEEDGRFKINRRKSE